MWIIELLPFLIVILLFIAFIAWLFREREPEIDESLKAKSDAYAKWMKTKTDEDYKIYLELKEAREIDKKKRGIKNLYDK